MAAALRACGWSWHRRTLKLIEVCTAPWTSFSKRSARRSLLPKAVAVRLVHWDELLAGELEDADQALVVRLVGDGLLLNAISGTPLAQEQVAALVDHLLPRPR